MHAYTDIRMHACMFVGIYIYAYMSVCKYVGMYVHIYACMSLTIITIIHPSEIHMYVSLPISPIEPR